MLGISDIAGSRIGRVTVACVPLSSAALPAFGGEFLQRQVSEDPYPLDG